MATAPQIRGEIAKATGVPQSVVETINRRLGEAELVPHHRRGRHAAHYEPIQVARILVGILSATDAFGSTVTRAAHAVQRVEALQETHGDGIILKWGEEKEQRREKISTGGNFINAIADIICSMRGKSELSNVVRAQKWRIGLVFGGNSYLAYVGNDANIVTQYVRAGDNPEGILGAPMVQRVHMTGEVLRALADILDVQASSKGGSATRDAQRDQLRIVSSNA